MGRTCLVVFLVNGGFLHINYYDICACPFATTDLVLKSFDPGDLGSKNAHIYKMELKIESIL